MAGYSFHLLFDSSVKGGKIAGMYGVHFYLKIGLAQKWFFSSKHKIFHDGFLGNNNHNKYMQYFFQYSLFLSVVGRGFFFLF